MKLIVLGLLAVMSLTGCIGAGRISDMKPLGEQAFPQLTGIDLLGAERMLPATFAGDLNIVIVAFEREQQEDVNTWIPAADELMAAHSGLKFYEIPLIYGINAPSRFWVNNGMRSGIPDPIARERTITVYTDREAFLPMMKMDASRISVLLVEKGGTIVWRVDGAADDKGIAALKAQVTDRFKQNP